MPYTLDVKEGILMAEMNVGMNYAVNPAAQRQNASIQLGEPRTGETGSAERSGREDNRRAENAAEQTGNRSQRELPNVVSVSEDGDTVQASPDSVDKLKEDASVRRIAGDESDQRDKSVRPEADFRTDDDAEKAEAERKEAEDAARERKEAQLQRVKEEQERRAEVMEKIEAENEEKEREEAKAERTSATRPEPAEPVRVDVGENSPERKITSFAGMTEQQLEQMYLKGTISKYDYDTELSSREERQEAAEQNSREFNQNSAEMIGIMGQTRQNFNAIEDAFDNPNKSADEARQANERLEAMNKVQETMSRQ